MLGLGRGCPSIPAPAPGPGVGDHRAGGPVPGGEERGEEQAGVVAPGSSHGAWGSWVHGRADTVEGVTVRGDKIAAIRRGPWGHQGM